MREIAIKQRREDETFSSLYIFFIGHIARLAGSPARKNQEGGGNWLKLLLASLSHLAGSFSFADSRLVGQALKFLQADDVPWQRVIASSGAISERGDGGEGANRQAVRLREGEEQKKENLLAL